jgi:energy-coupling factor transporter ATP-binding protein EcfA2
MSEQLISAIRIEKLFGLYTYDLPASGSLANAAILYGDNGVGKSTILRAAFHLLSTSEKSGHRTALYKIPFKVLEVDLSDGVTLRAERESVESEGFLTLSVKKSQEIMAVWDYQPRLNQSAEMFESDAFILDVGPDGRPFMRRKRVAADKKSLPRGEKAYLKAMKSSVPNVFLLNADRRLDSDSVADPGDELELRKVMRYEEPKRIYDLVVRSREIALSQALGAAARWINRKALEGANQGSMNVHGVYINVLRHLLTPNADLTEKRAAAPADLIKKLAAIETRSSELARYEFTASISTTEFKKSLSARGQRKKELAAELLQPYIDSLESRLNALSGIYYVVDRFVSIVNSFLSDKTLKYSLTNGFSMQNRLGSPLAPSQLSSGEQQLLLLFCYVLTSRDSPSVFMIDEPEISLNIKWQRQLIQSLLDVTKGANIQFIFASHSMELLTPHRERVVRLVAGQ